MKIVMIALTTMALSVTAFANSYDLKLDATDSNGCRARVMDVAKAFAGYPVKISMNQQFDVQTVDVSETVVVNVNPCGCSATLMSEGNSSLVVSPVHFESACSEVDLHDAKMSGAAFVNARPDARGCMVDVVSVK
jgi:hypothetical protein